MSDRALVLGVLRAAPGVVLVEPGPHLVMRDEVHDEARAELARRGLPASHPYVGWHTQADGFDGAGALVRPQRVLFGGDRAVVARALAELEPHGFAVLGGRTDGEVFVLHRDAAPARVEPALAEEWRTRLAVLCDEPLAPLRDGERARLHEVVAHAGMRDLLAPAVRALRLRRALTGDDLDVACSPEGLEALGSEAPAVVSHALGVGHARSREAASALAARGWADGALLRAWNDPGALRTARAAALGGRDTGVYLDLVEWASGPRGRRRRTGRGGRSRRRGHPGHRGRPGRAPRRPAARARPRRPARRTGAAVAAGRRRRPLDQDSRHRPGGPVAGRGRRRPRRARPPAEPRVRPHHQGR
ncbi:hypothetical protein K7G98_23870, partial [Saccharothrix sp. MB29]|nr:hypothetical protein [Saccharothrix sp. MB29]